MDLLPVDIQSVSKMRGRKSRSQFPPTKLGKLHFFLCSQTRNFQGTAPTFARPQSFRFLSLGIFKIPVHSAAIEIIFNVFKTIHKWTAIFKCVRHSLIRPAHVCIASGGGRLEHLLSIVTLNTIRTQILIVYP
jgi:hypothetical protein